MLLQLQAAAIDDVADDGLSSDLRVSNQTRRDKTQLIVCASVDYGWSDLSYGMRSEHGEWTENCIVAFGEVSHMNRLVL